jgi:multiple sugar transport system ATP-binding protein
MHRGRLQQADTPKALYDRPVNLFVAAFIGSPAMNLVHSRLAAEDGAVTAECGQTLLRLPQSLLERRPKLAEYLGGPVILGIRPEDIEDAALVPSANGAALDVDCRLAEPLGAEVIAHFPLSVRPAVGPDVGATAMMTARLNPRSRAETGAPLRVAVDVERLYFFDPETEAAIW